MCRARVASTVQVEFPDVYWTWTIAIRTMIFFLQTTLSFLLYDRDVNWQSQSDDFMGSCILMRIISVKVLQCAFRYPRLWIRKSSSSCWPGDAVSFSSLLLLCALTDVPNWPNSAWSIKTDYALYAPTTATVESARSSPNPLLLTQVYVPLWETSAQTKLTLEMWMPHLSQVFSYLS